MSTPTKLVVHPLTPVPDHLHSWKECTCGAWKCVDCDSLREAQQEERVHRLEKRLAALERVAEAAKAFRDVPFGHRGAANRAALYIYLDALDQLDGEGRRP